MRISAPCSGFALAVSLCLTGLSTNAVATVHRISTAAALGKLIQDAKTLKPGDTIQLADGTYSGTVLVATVSGAKGAPITLQGSPSAKLTNPGGYGFQLKARYWKLTGFTVEKSQKGIVLDGASNNVIDQVIVRYIDDEGIRLRTFSSRNVIRNSVVSSTGLGKGRAPYGEAIYIGSPFEHWAANTGGLPDRSDYNCVSNNRLMPNVSAEGIDVKEGTTGGWILNNVHDLSSLSKLSMDINGGDSFMDVKGDGYVLYGNQVSNTGKNLYLLAGFQVHQKTFGGKAYGNNNLFQSNSFNLNGTGAYAFEIDSKTTGNKVCLDNKVSNVTKGLVDTAASKATCAVVKTPPVCGDVLNQ